MTSKSKIYACIDLKSFFASVECVERGLNPFDSNLVVADATRGQGSICLAITPKMKSLGVHNRCRVFEIPKNLDYYTAKPRMKLYMEYSVYIYSILLRYISHQDIHVYSIDECFIDITSYLHTYNLTPRELVNKLTFAIFLETGICATAGIGTNLFLAKVALDVLAKHAPDYIGILDDDIFRQKIWHYQPITDIWNIGKGIAERLKNKFNVIDLFGVSQIKPELLYKEFGSNAEFLIDHSKGIEPCTIAEIKAYIPKENSIHNSQILFEDYSFENAKIVLYEMVDFIVLELIEKDMVASGISLGIGYSKSYEVSNNGKRGRDKEQGVYSSRKMPDATDSLSVILALFMQVYEDIVLKDKPIRKISVSLTGIVPRDLVGLQLDMFIEPKNLDKERNVLKTIIDIKDKFGKNSLVRAISLDKHATAIKRNKLIGGHNGE